MDIINRYKQVRKLTEGICVPLETEDFVVQPVADVSPPKWHIGHTTWFFETFILKPFVKNYIQFNPDYNFVFNSYYETVGARVIRTDRGNLSRPTVRDILEYRKHVDQAMNELLNRQLGQDVNELLELGCNHEEQHQELLLTDIKYILGNNPLFPPYDHNLTAPGEELLVEEWARIGEGIYEVGFMGNGFCFDNELGRH